MAMNIYPSGRYIVASRLEKPQPAVAPVATTGKRKGKKSV